MLENDFKKQIESNGVISFVPKGNSMWPFLKNKGQSIIIEKKTDRLKVFDVGFFLRQDGTAVLHRVIEVLENGYIFRGDSQVYTEKVSEENVFGKMLGFYKGKKYIEASDKNYQKKVKKWIENEKKRKFRCDMFYRKLSLKAKIKKLFKGKKDV